MDKESMEKLLFDFKDEIIKKIECTAEILNTKIDKNTMEISIIKDEMATNSEKLENNIMRAETNTDDIGDLKLRLDKLEKEKQLNDQRFDSIETEIDKKTDTPPKVRGLINDLNKIKEDALNNKEITELKDELSNIKQTYAEAASKSPVKKNKH